MRKPIAVVAALIAVATLAGCGSSDSPADDSSTTTTAVAETTTTTNQASAVIEPGPAYDSSVENGRPVDQEGLIAYVTGTDQGRDLVLVNPIHLAKSICGLFDAGFSPAEVDSAVLDYLNNYYRAQSGSGVIWTSGSIGFYTYSLTKYTCPEYESKYQS
ncbi:DUF732 domain-containing protein [Gordonia alkanivorans]|uniref:DUF732 domain-containing protein n=1 Tax=Gordonia alkanivorans TaxID=84096 RepID=UPI001F4DCAF5|nr:DUF732 domain-containing protein [Gordonia alkanivorans]